MWKLQRVRRIGICVEQKLISSYVIVDLLITFHVSCRRSERYCGHARLCVCVCSPRPHTHTIGLLHGEWYGMKILSSDSKSLQNRQDGRTVCNGFTRDIIHHLPISKHIDKCMRFHRAYIIFMRFHKLFSCVCVTFVNWCVAFLKYSRSDTKPACDRQHMAAMMTRDKNEGTSKMLRCQICIWRDKFLRQSDQLPDCRLLQLL